MKIALDTNVLLSVFIAHGLCHELFNFLIENGHELIISDNVLMELERHLKNKFAAPSGAIQDLMITLSENGSIVSDRADVTFDCPDPDDTPILAAAFHAQAKYFVTGDKALLNLKAIGLMPIISPRECWITLRTDADVF
ncbi:MAG TPA: putative toxin-antitoxin system toxin component, PIN family [Gammaproteobacteria bacterium]|nr:putative toxin-antitoxin system toxin component, PIN family [Gammaproteobacteria bacterium]